MTTRARKPLRAVLRLLPTLAPLVLVPLLLAPWFPRYVYHWDEAQLALGLERFDLSVHQPHPPGYYLFVVCGRIIARLVDTPENALRWVALLATATAAALIGWALPRELRGSPRLGLAAIAVSFVALSPVVFFYSISALTYTVEAACWLAVLLALTHRLQGRGLLVLGIGLGLSTGLRPTLLVWGLLAVFATWLLHRAWPDFRGIGRLGAGLLVGLLAWVVPMLAETGGPTAYLNASGPLMSGNIWAKSIGHVGVGSVVGERLPLMLRDLWLSLGPLLLFPPLGLLMRSSARYRSRLARWDLLVLGAAIPFLFYATLIYDSQGYILACTLPLAAYAFIVLGEILVDAGRPARGIGLTLAAALSATLLVIPGGHASDAGGRRHQLVEHDAMLDRRFETVRESFPPESTVLVTSLEYWSWGFRHVMYYLPDYTVIQLVPDPFVAGTAAERPYLTGRGHRTWLSGPETISAGSLAERPAAVTHVVYMVPDDVPRFVDASCLPHLRPLPVGESAFIGALTHGTELRVAISRGRLHCLHVAR